MSRRRAALIVVLVGLVSTLGYQTWRRDTVAAHAEVQLLPGPAAWVPFRAEFRVMENGLDAGTGFYYRDSNGSVRDEAFSPDKTERVITITHYPTRTTYLQSPKGEWAALPLPDRVRSKPPLYRRSTRGLSATPEEWNGLTVYRYIDPRNEESLLAPDLNFFAVVRQNAKHGEEFFNIVREEPPAHLFLPPARASVRIASDRNDLYKSLSKR